MNSAILLLDNFNANLIQISDKTNKPVSLYRRMFISELSTASQTSDAMEFYRLLCDNSLKYLKGLK